MDLPKKDVWQRQEDETSQHPPTSKSWQTKYQIHPAQNVHQTKNGIQSGPWPQSAIVVSPPHPPIVTSTSSDEDGSAVSGLSGVCATDQERYPLQPSVRSAFLNETTNNKSPQHPHPPVFEPKPKLSIPEVTPPLNEPTDMIMPAMIPQLQISSNIPKMDPYENKVHPNKIPPVQTPNDITYEDEITEMPDCDEESVVLTQPEVEFSNIAPEDVPDTNILVACLVVLCFNPVIGLWAVSLSMKSHKEYMKGNVKRGRYFTRMSTILSLVGVSTTFLIVTFVISYLAVRGRG